MPISIDQTDLEHWAERDRLHVGLRWKSEFKDGEMIADWWDEDAAQMFEDGFFSTKGHVLGRMINDAALHTSVYEYCRTMGMLPEDPTVACCECGGRFIAPRITKLERQSFTCFDCVEEYRKNQPKAYDPKDWRNWLRSSRRFQEA